MSKFLTTVAAAALLALPATAFEIDSRYTDADGDLIADIPTDEIAVAGPVDADLRIHPG